MSNHRFVRMLALGVFVWLHSTGVAQDSFQRIGSEYSRTIQPLLKRYCLRCHNEKKQEADLNLARFRSLQEVRKAPKVWQKVRYMVVNREMPPKKSRQLTRDESKSLLAWVQGYLKAEAIAGAGDPGRVVLRRLNNVEYDNSIRDLTGVPFKVSQQFPADSAAGEGFTNTGDSLVMSPALLDKYLAAAREVSRHAVLLHDGFRFSKSTSRRDWTHEILDRIRLIHQRHTKLYEERNRGAVTRIQWGEVEIRDYLAALVKHRNQLAQPGAVLRIAKQENLNPRYLARLSVLLENRALSPVLRKVSQALRSANADTKSVDRIVRLIKDWQKNLWQFKPVGQFFENGQQPKDTITTSQTFRFKLQPRANSNVVNVGLVAGDAGDGNKDDRIVWQNPRMVAKGLPTILLRDMRPLIARFANLRKRMLTRTADYLEAVGTIARKRDANLAAVARAGNLEEPILRAWLDYLYIQPAKNRVVAKTTIRGLFKGRRKNVQDYKFINGWASTPTSPYPTLLVNSSNKRVRIPGIFRPKSVLIHPSPTHFVGAAWKSPIQGVIRIKVFVTDIHPECGNGQAWTLLWQKGTQQQRLGAGVMDAGKSVATPAYEDVYVHPGDLITLAVGPRDGNHGCDATRINLVITEVTGKQRDWGLEKDIVENVLVANPHPDRHGNKGVWHFFTDTVRSLPQVGSTLLPVGSVLTKWRTAMITGQAAKAKKLAATAQLLLRRNTPPRDPADRRLYEQIRSAASPLIRGIGLANVLKEKVGDKRAASAFGLDVRRFVAAKTGEPATSLLAKAPQTIQFNLPADLLSDYEFVVDAVTAPGAREASVQVRAGVDAVAIPSELTRLPVLVGKGSPAQARTKRALDEFRRLFPRFMVCRTIVPLDNVVTLVQFHREDEHLSRLLLSDTERNQLDRLWTELRYVSRDAIKIHDTFDLFQGFASQVGKVKLFEPLRKGINQRAAAFRKYMKRCEPAHLTAVERFADRAFRRPLSTDERLRLRKTYQLLRRDEQSHEDAIQGLIMRILVSPRFLYRIEQPRAGKQPGAVSSHELATRLSYLLWSSMPDARLRGLADSGKIVKSDVMIEQTRRMLKSQRIGALATEFACQWLGFHGFDTFNEKNERQYPTFKKLRGAMYQEAVRFFTDLFQRDGSILEIIDGDSTFVNRALARHYGLQSIESKLGNRSANVWLRVKGMKSKSRGGVLGMSVMLARQSGATRTSPVLRGNWIVETLLGERIPDPPPTVPELPDKISSKGLTVRQLTEQHVRAAQCAKCHVRIDPFGFALESFDAIGRFRTKDLVNKPVDTRAKLRDGSVFNGIAGLRTYLLKKRRRDFVRQFCRKLLGYSLGRSVQLSDEPLIEEMIGKLERNQYKFSIAVETIVRSRQFRYHRGLEATRNR